MTEVVLNNKVPFNRFVSEFRKFRDTVTLKNSAEKICQSAKSALQSIAEGPISRTMTKIIIIIL
jgi:hypothetical protein